MPSVHRSVLLNEIAVELAELDLKSTFYYLDGTLGGAGHALKIAEIMKGNLVIIGLDRDEQALERAKIMLSGKANKIILENEDYRNLDKVLEKHDLKQVDAILLDLGLSSDELDNSGRGFTFQKDEPLIMTFGDPAKYPFTATDIVNNWSEEVLADIFFGYGEEKFARRIAKSIVSYRTKARITKTAELNEIIRMSVPVWYRHGKTNPATKTFQALRIAVNDELNALKQGLIKGYEYLAPGGKFAVISFHSLEDRIVKEFFREKAKANDDTISKKPITASGQELQENPRSRSAKLRFLEKNKK